MPRESIFSIPLTEYRDTIGGRVDPGRYTVRVDHVEPSKAKSGRAMFVVTLVIVGGVFSGTTVIDRLTYLEPDGKTLAKAAFRLVEFMQALGLDTSRKTHRVDISRWTGRKLGVDLADGQPYRDKVKSEVQGYLRLSGSSDDTTDPEPEDGTSDDGWETYDEADEAPADVSDPWEADDEDDAEDERPAPAKKLKPAPVDDGPETIDLDDIDL